jgi:hypothetical protein
VTVFSWKAHLLAPVMFVVHEIAWGLGGGLLLYRKKRRLCSVQPLVTRSSDDGKGYLGASWHLICSLQLENTDLPWNCPPPAPVGSICGGVAQTIQTLVQL